jgi:hypothetical protein
MINEQVNLLYDGFRQQRLENNRVRRILANLKLTRRIDIVIHIRHGCATAANTDKIRNQRHETTQTIFRRHTLGHTADLETVGIVTDPQRGTVCTDRCIDSEISKTDRPAQLQTLPQKTDQTNHERDCAITNITRQIQLTHCEETTQITNITGQVHLTYYERECRITRITITRTTDKLRMR